MFFSDMLRSFDSALMNGDQIRTIQRVNKRGHDTGCGMQHGPRHHEFIGGGATCNFRAGELGSGGIHIRGG